MRFSTHLNALVCFLALVSSINADSGGSSIATTLQEGGWNAPIGANDTVSVHGRYLQKADGTRFLLKGIAFPDPPKPSYDAQSWIAVLHQLRDLQLKYNAVRLYRMNPSIDYSEFFNEAARLGIYVMVPLTSAQGGGVINRAAGPMKCYPRSLYEFGVESLKNYLRYPNVIAGLLGNEVMNSPETWTSAPCVKAYGRDLRLWMNRELEKGTIPRLLPLVYAAQNTGIGPAVGPANAMKMTMDYLTCIPDEGKMKTWQRMAEEEDPDKRQQTHDKLELEDDGGTAIDIFGINVESWCSSFDTYETNVDGTQGTYHMLHEGLTDTNIPLIFSEMGCAHDLYDGDIDEFGGALPENNEGPTRKQGERTWSQVPVVLNEMSDIWAGFFAYAYDGSPEFVMFGGGPWDGENVLEPTADFYGFKDQLDQVAAMTTNSTNNEKTAGDSFSVTTVPPLCHIIEKEIQDLCGIEIEDFRRIPTRVRSTPRVVEYVGGVLVGLFLIVCCCKCCLFRRRRSTKRHYEIIV